MSIFQVRDGKSYSTVLDNINKLQKTSKNPFLVIASDKTDFLRSLVESLQEYKALVWSTRLLLITRLRRGEVLALAGVMSQVNAMVLTRQDGGIVNGWRIHLYIPYSGRDLEVARWSSENGFVYKTNYGLFPDKFNKLLDGAHLATTAEVYPPHLMEKEAGDEQAGNPFRGPTANILNILASSLNFTFSVIRPPDGSFGILLPNGSWTGMIGMQLRKEVDFSFAAFSMLYSRAQVVDYTFPIVIEYGRIVAKKGEIEANPFGFLLPLTITVWLLLLMALAVLMIVSQLIAFLLMKSDVPVESYALGNYIRIFLVQDIKKTSVKDHSRSILVGTWLMSMLIVMESYAGNLRSLLIARHVPQPYHTVRAVVDDPRATVLWVAGTSYYQILQSFDSGVFKELADEADQGKIDFIDSTEFYESIETKVSKGGYVLMSEELTLKILVSSYFSKTGSCLFYLSREAFFPLMTAITTQKYSPLIYPFNQRVVTMTEAGLYEYWVKKETMNYTSCVNTPTKIVFQSPLSIYSLWGIFVILGGGHLLGTLAILLEIVTDRLSPMKQEQEQI